MGKFVVEDDLHVFFVAFGSFFAEGIFSRQEIDGRCKPCSGRCFGHLRKSDFYVEEYHSFACSRYMRKKAMLHRIELGFVRWVMSDAYFDANSIG